MTTATGEYGSLASQLSALSIAALTDADADAEPAPAPSPSSSSVSSPREALPGKGNGGGALRGAAADTPWGKAWRSPPRRVPDCAGVAFMEELGSSWPVPSRDDAHGRRKTPQGSQQLQADPPSLGRPGTPGAAAMAPPPSSSPESSANGDPVPPPVDRQRKQLKETWDEKRRGSGTVAMAAPRGDLPRPVANNNSRMPRPPLLPAPRQQQGRPPQNGRRGRNQQHFPHHHNGDHNNNGHSGNHQQHRPRHHWNAHPFSHQQPPQVINDSFYRPMNQMVGFPSLPPDWGFNAMPILQWGPNPHIAPPYFGTVTPPPENMFPRGYFPGPHFPEAFPYSAPPVSPTLPPPPGWNAPWLMTPPPGEVAQQNQPPNPPLPLSHNQPPAMNTQKEGEDVELRLRQQIEYYFSDENLMKDGYLKTCMDNQGWVSVYTIANFPRVRRLTTDVDLILGALQASSMVEVSVDKMRRKGEWSKWIIR